MTFSKLPSNPTQTETKARLLVVDDDESVRDSLVILFGSTYEVTQAECGEAAIRLLSKTEYDVVILDVCMPGMDGNETLEQMKRSDPGIEVIMLTAYESIESTKRALRSGALDYITKPFEIDLIRLAVRKAVRKRRQTRQLKNRILKLNDYREEIEVERIQARLAEARSEVYASVIHDINGPLTVISGFAGILSDNIRRVSMLDGQDLQSTRNYIEEIKKQVEACVRVSKRYLNYYREKRDHAVCTCINEAFRDVQDLLAAHPATSGNKLAFTPLAEDRRVRVNGADLIQILINLCLNALQSTSTPHHVRVAAIAFGDTPDWERFVDEPGKRRVICGAPSKGTQIIRIIVRDNGDGIEPDILQKLFREQFTTREKSKGTGLGLSIIRRLLEDAGGAIEVRSTPGNGATFTLFLAEV